MNARVAGGRHLAAGMSLVEMVVVVGLMAVILLVTGNLFRTYQSTLNSAKSQERLQQARRSLDRIAAELRGGRSLAPVPSNPSPVASLTLEIADRALPAFPTACGAPPPSSWDPAAGRIQVTYRVVGAELVRESPTGTAVMVDQVEGFSIQNLTPALAEFTLRVLLERRPATLSLRVHREVEP